MALQLLSGPSIEPVSLDDAKSFLRVDHSHEDLLIGSLITAARIHVEVALSRALISQDWAMFLDAWPSDGVVELAVVPLQAVSEIRLHDREGGFSTLDTDSYDVDAVSEPARLVLRPGAALSSSGRSTNGIEIRFSSGYGGAASDVPAPIVQAMQMLVTHWYERREPVALGETGVEVPKTATSLLAPYKQVRL